MTVLTPTLHHLNIKTTQLQVMIDWYQLVVGARIVFQNEVIAFLTNDAANHRISFLAPPTLKDDPDKRHRSGMHHSAFEYASFDDLASSYERLRDEGVTPTVCLDHGMTISMYYTDPDGNLVELQSDLFGDWRKSTEWMEQELPKKTTHIVGYYFHPEPAITAYRAGLPFDELRDGIKRGDFGNIDEGDLGIDL